MSHSPQDINPSVVGDQRRWDAWHEARLDHNRGDVALGVRFSLRRGSALSAELVAGGHVFRIRRWA